MVGVLAQPGPSIQTDEDSIPVWLWPNLLSLDAPLVAVLWQGFLADQYAVPVGLAGRLTLGLTVWAIYLLDRLLDARKPPSGWEPARHRYYRRHTRRMTALLAIVLAADTLIAIFGLRPVTLRDGLIALAAVLIYLAIFHLSGHRVRIPKEVAAAGLFTTGTFLAVWAKMPSSRLAWPAAAFFVLCLANMIAIEAWEWRALPKPFAAPHPCTQWLARTYRLWVPFAMLVCALAGRNEWYLSIAISAGACALLFFGGSKLSLEARRALVDGVLLTPILFLMLR